MTTRTYIIFASITFFLHSQQSIAEDISIYRWVDQNNVVHFSQNQPTKDGYSQLSIFSAYKAGLQSTQKTATSNGDKSNLKQQQARMDEIALKNKETYKKNCKAAKLNIKMLNSFKKVLYTDTEGKSRVLSPEEKKEQLSLSKKHIDLYCESK